jgi:splicing factor 3A subunit 3
MSGTLLEQTRAFHEETERLERCIVQELQKETKSHKERLHQNHRVNNMRHAILDATGKLVSFLVLYHRSRCGPLRCHLS